MKGITMCPEEICPLAGTCYRSIESGTKPVRRQWWGNFRCGYDTKNNTCDYYLRPEMMIEEGPLLQYVEAINE